MSIYKDPCRFWPLIELASPERKVQLVATMIEYQLASSPEDRIHIKQVLMAVEADTIARERITHAAVELLKREDRVRFRPSAHTIQYRPLAERRNLTTDLLINEGEDNEYR